MASPITIREVQSLNEKLVVLGRFLVRLVEKTLPLFKTLKGCMSKNDFEWDKEIEKAFQELKAHLKSLPALTIPKLGEMLILYLVVSNKSVSSVLMADREKVE